jgi:transposase InsO family protein
VVDKYRISERRACRIIGQPRSSQRYKAVKRADEDEITAQIVELASTYGRYGYRMITAMLHGRGYHINHKGVYRIWRTLGLKVPQKQPKRKRLWLNDGSCIRLRAEYPNHVWSYDFAETRTSKGRKIKILNIIDEYTRECLASHAAFRIRSEDVKNVLREVMTRKGTPDYLRSDNGSEFIAKHLRKWLSEMEAAPM